MKYTLFTALLSFALLSAAAPPRTIQGVITDTMCGAHHNMIRGQADDDCIRTCVKGAREFALYDGKEIWKLNDQKTPSRFAAKMVKVTGVADEKSMTIKVTSIEPAE
jgi:hypothetical protein